MIGPGEIVRAHGDPATPMRLLLPRAPQAPAVVLLCDVFGVTPAVLEIGQRLQERGYAVAIPDLLWRGVAPARDGTRGELEAAHERFDDGQAVRDVDAVRRTLAHTAGVDARSLSVFGVGVGGTIALLAAAALVGFRSAVCVTPRLVYPTLTLAKPTQPLDLLPGLRSAVQVHCAEEDPLVPPQHVETLRQRLDSRVVVHQVLTYAGVGQGFVEPLHLGYEPAAAKLAWIRATRFLDRVSGIGTTMPLP
jgi:carboxymethylenebutenolidase